MLAERGADVAPDFLTIGHVSKDITDVGYNVGGTVTYAGRLGVRLGLDTAVVTSCAEDLPIRRALDGASISVRPSPDTTTFLNMYDGSERRQRLLGRADQLGLADVPPEWRSSRIVLLGPVAAELRPDVFNAFQNSLKGVAPQGMMRSWDESGMVHPVRWEEAERLLGGVDVVVMSREDLPDARELQRYADLVPVVAVTHSERGATVYEHGRERSFPAYRCDPVDPTGAGDVFAAAFLIELDTSGSIERAARFANSAASYVIEAEGVAGVPYRDQVLQRMEAAVYVT